MLSKEFYLLTESCFLNCYLLERWIKSFGKCSNFKGVLLVDKDSSQKTIQKRRFFHEEYVGQKKLNTKMDKTLQELYSGFDDTERSLIHLFGIPKCSTSYYDKTYFLGDDVNGDYAKKYLRTFYNNQNPPYIFMGIGTILKSWWIEMSKSKIINVHSAILPYARGIYSIENIAAVQDLQKFRQSVGVTVHYIDAGVDTGPIIRAKRLIDPFRFNSIWELKGCLFMMGFDLQIDVAKDIVNSQEAIPVGIIQNTNLRGPNFKKKDFTLEKQKQAEVGYLSMKLQIQKSE